ncbi:MAG: DNA adenine methylase [Nitrososphaeraceae archaeon]
MSKISGKHIVALQANSKPDLLNLYDRNVPHIIKYMGAKRTILDFVIGAINETYEEGKLCDLFGGTSIISGALGKLIPIHSNDIQEYSAVLAQTYLSNYKWDDYSLNILDEIVDKASVYVESIRRKYPGFVFSYSEKKTIEEFIELEKQQQDLIGFDFCNLTHYLFIKNYSGTYWSYQQCVWIDAFRKVADEYKGTPVYYLILSSLMFAMSYNSQSTGHYAQFRDATSSSSKMDILIYRQKEILPYFIKKFMELQNYLGENNINHTVTSLDYAECLDQIAPNSLVYADPPYAFVHYSRFYHALETLVRYDYPIVTHKGRYRTDRHQSPFCKKTEVKSAFIKIFSKIKDKEAQLILSYSNTGMVSLNEILDMAGTTLGFKYGINIKEVGYKHSTMGRKNDKNRMVQEYLIIAKRK